MAHGLVLDAFRWDFPGALAALDRAVALRPDYAEAHAWRGMMLAALRRFADALRATEQAVKLAPLSLPLRAQVGWVLFWAGDAHAAIDAWNATVPVDPNFPLARYNLALGYIKLGAYSRAVAELKRALQLVPDRIPYIARLARAEAMAGNPREAERLLGLLYERSTTEYVPHVHFASIHVALGNHDAAVRELERAFHEREPSLTGDDHPESFWWDPLRGDTRFQRLVQGHPVPFVRSPGTFRGPSRFHNPLQFTAQNWIRHGKSTPARQNAPPTLRRVTAAMEGVAFARGAQRRRIRIRSCGAGPRR